MDEGNELRREDAPPRSSTAPPRNAIDSSTAAGILGDPDSPINHLWDYVGSAVPPDAQHAIHGGHDAPTIVRDHVAQPVSRPPSEWMTNLQVQRSQCSGMDSHALGMSTKRRIIATLICAILGVLILFTGDMIRLGPYAGGLLFSAVLVGGFSVRVVGDTLVSRRIGVAKRVPLKEISNVEPYSYRGNVSLRLWTRAGKRAPSISVIGRSLVNPAHHIDPTTAAHLLRYLDRPDVQWGPGAWRLLASAAGHTSDGTASETVGAPRGPLGSLVPKRPPTRWQRRILRIGSGCALLCMVALVAFAPLAWSEYSLSQTIQHGPEVTATLRSQWVTSSTDRSGTSYTTHFDVTFYDVDRHSMVATQVSAHGYFSSAPVGSQIYIRYNPANPLQAELPGHPNHSFIVAVVMTGLALLTLAAAPWVVPRLYRRVVGAPKASRAETLGPGPIPGVEPS